MALEVIAEEERKSNHRLARDLMRILDNGIPTAPLRLELNANSESLPKDRERHAGLVDVRQPNCETALRRG